MDRHDAIIVLGEPIDSNGDMGSELKSRLDAALKSFKNKDAGFIIVSGGKTSHNKPNFSEAEGMKRYLVKNGVNPKFILKEEYSKDTIGNALFTKTRILDEKRWENIIVVTSDYHIPRARYIFKRILGGKFRITFIASKSKMSILEKNEKDIKEKILLGLDKVFMDEIHMILMKE